MNGPDLPEPNQPMTSEAFRYRWPTGTEKTELIEGVIVFYGDFDERDARTARQTYPGRRITIDPGGALRVHPATG
ncbi:hypothetical protein [Streptomyces lavendulocolor]|uniref:hypothetical protein n=1 Tax=Streptomyces lavendulocolor TaxID=67316 RepID=UPI0033EB7EC5